MMDPNGAGILILTLIGGMMGSMAHHFSSSTVFGSVMGLKNHRGDPQNRRTCWEDRSMGDLQHPKMEVRKRTILLAIFCGDIP